MGSMMEFDDILYIILLFFFLTYYNSVSFLSLSVDSFFFFILCFNVWIYLQTEMPTKAPGQGRSSTRSDAEESEIGHSSARRRVHRRGREVSECVCAAPNSRQVPFPSFAPLQGSTTSAKKQIIPAWTTSIITL
jgi:hypothetical protein